MQVIPVSHLNLVRVRREMEKLYLASDWEAIKDLDPMLSSQLNAAFDDPNRMHTKLVSELEKILALYGSMVRKLPEKVACDWLRPGSAS